MAKTLYVNIAELITNQGVAEKGGVAVKHDDLGIMENGALLWDSSRGILWMGPTDAVPSQAVKGAKKVNLVGKIMAPALVDCHTHLVFSGSRHDEFAMRLEGATYQQIAATGGGIANSVKATRETTEADLYRQAKQRVELSLSLGIGLIEIKSGYGLDWPTERKMLRVATRLKREFSKRAVIQTTFLGAHAFPANARSPREREEYVDRLVDEMLPQVAKERLADACDVFFDEGYFNEAQSRRILRAARKLGLQTKLHADELADTGGAALAAELDSLSADHLLKANDVGLKKMAERGVVAVLLPTTALYLGIGYAPLGRMRKHGLCFALATDFNPGTSPTQHLPFVMSLACLQMGMTMPEAFAAATYGGARAMGLHAQHGHLRAGGKPKIAVFDCLSYKSLIAQLAHPRLAAALI